VAAGDDGFVAECETMACSATGLSPTNAIDTIVALTPAAAGHRISGVNS